MKTFTGKVIAKKMSKTATVAVERVITHPLYGKKFRSVKKYHVHDEINAKVGDVVLFAPSRPYSRLKRWKIIKVISEQPKSAVSKKKIKKEVKK